MSKFSLSILAILPLYSMALFFGNLGGGGGGGCCCGAPAAPACAPAVSSCCSGGGYGPASSGYAAAFPSFGQSFAPQPSYAPSYASAPSSYASAPSSYAAAPPVVPSGYAKPSYSVPPPPSYNAPPPPPPPASYNSAPSSYNAAPPPPNVPSYSNSGASSYQQSVQPSQIKDENYGGSAATAAGGKLQIVEEEEANAELNAVAANSSLPSAAADPSPPIDVSLLKLSNDTECNSEELREIISQNMSEDLNTSKRLIQLAAEAKFGGRFDVICSQNDFSYVTNTELFCQHTQDRVSCYAYRQL